MRGHYSNGMALAKYLDEHPQIEAVYYPGLPQHPQHEIAKAQMSDFGGMLSVLVKGGFEEAKRVVNRVKLFAQATSLGGIESLIEHRASVEGPDTKTPGGEGLNKYIKNKEQKPAFSLKREGRFYLIWYGGRV